MKLLFFLGFAALPVMSWAQCTVDIQTGLSSSEPVFLRRNQLWIPEGPVLQWGPRETTLIACPRSLVKNTMLEVAPITCLTGTTFLLAGSATVMSNISCTNRVTGDLLSTPNICGTTGFLKYIGFNVINIGFLNYIQLCYNQATASVLYTRHQVHGKAIDYSVTESYRPSFKVAGMPATVSPTASYTQAWQSTRLTALLGSSALSTSYMSVSYLARGHVSPDADGIFRPWQWATYYYVNVVPQWQKVNAGNWLTVETAIRNVASRLGESVTIYTGGAGVLGLTSASGATVPITLEDGGIPVPKWTWKIIKSPSKNAAIALVTSNDPFRTSFAPAELLCPTDICSQYGWSNTDYTDYSLGFTYCCPVGKLIEKVPTVPGEANAINVLNF